MGGLPVEGFLSLSSNLWSSTLKSKDSQIVCAFCLDLNPHEHSVVGKITVSGESCTVKLQLVVKSLESVKNEQYSSTDECSEEKLEEDFDEDEKYFTESRPEDTNIGNGDTQPVFVYKQLNDICLTKVCSPEPTLQEESVDEDEYFVEYDLSNVIVDENVTEDPLPSSSKLEEQPESNGTTTKKSGKKIHRLKPVLNMVVVEEKKEFPCAICNKIFKQKRNLRTHLTYHSAERPYACDICQKGFKYQAALKVHKSAIHGIDLQSHVCELCGIHVPTQNHLRYHKRAKHSTTKLICPHCSKEFKVTSSYNRHVKLHFGIKEAPQQCPVCGLTYSRPDTLRAHMKIHTSGIHTHTCDTCEETFPSFKKLRAHAQQHRFIRMFQNATSNGDSVV